MKTVLQHAWAEFEHDIRYKPSGDVNPAINRAFTLASGLIELADDQFVTIHTEMSRESDASREGKLKYRLNKLCPADG